MSKQESYLTEQQQHATAKRAPLTETNEIKSCHHSKHQSSDTDLLLLNQS